MGGAPMPYTYLGRLAYVTHDAERERPVYFQWQAIDDWPPPPDVLARMRLELTDSGEPASVPAEMGQQDTERIPELVETAPPPPRPRRGTRTDEFRGRKNPERSELDARNRRLGLAGEVAVIAREQNWLRANGRADLAERVRHVAVIEGDGAGYDVASFDLQGSLRYIEVKTTRGRADTDFFVSANEVEFSRQHASYYALYRVYEFNAVAGRARFYVRRGELLADAGLELQPIQFRVRLVSPTAS